MRTWTDRLVLGGLAVIGGGLISVGAGNALARYTISGSPVLVAAADDSDAAPVAYAGDDDLVRLADELAPPPRLPYESD